MAPKTCSSPVLFLTLNLLFFALVSACGTCCGPTPTPMPTPNRNPNPNPRPNPNPPNGSCPVDPIELDACANVLNGGLLNVSVGQPSGRCCSLIQGLADLDAAVCICTALRANILGISLNIPISLNLLLNSCSRQPPTGYRCV